LFRWPKLIAVHDLASATAAINEITGQGEGARGDSQPAHYGRFLGIWEEYTKLNEADPAFEPTFLVVPGFTRQPYDITEPQPLLTDPLTRAIAEVFNLGYEVLLHTRWVITDGRDRERPEPPDRPARSAGDSAVGA
jgi:hypothetical protein